MILNINNYDIELSVLKDEIYKLENKINPKLFSSKEEYEKTVNLFQNIIILKNISLYYYHLVYENEIIGEYNTEQQTCCINFFKLGISIKNNYSLIVKQFMFEHFNLKVKIIHHSTIVNRERWALLTDEYLTI